MKASEIILDVRRELVETNPAFWSDAELLRHLNRGQLDFVNRTRVLEDVAFLSTTPGRGDYPLPANFLSIKLVLHNKPNADGVANWRRVNPASLEKWGQERANFMSTATGSLARPQEYMLWSRTMWVAPAPSADNSSSSDLYIWYKSKPVRITDTNQDLEIDDVLCEAVTEYMLWKAWAKEKEADLSEQHMNNYLAYVKEGHRFAKKQAGDLRNRFDIESPYGFYGSTTSFNPLA